MQILLRRICPVLAAASLLTPLSLISPAAFAQQAGEIKTTPASDKEVATYRLLAVEYFCLAREVEVEYPKAIGIAATVMSRVINIRHGGYVAAAGKKKITPQQLYGNSTFQILGISLKACPESIPADAKTKIENEIKKANKKLNN